MIVILLFVTFVLVGDLAAVMVASMFERISEFVGLIVFLGLFILVFVAAWYLAVWVAERYLISRHSLQQPPG